MTNHRLRPSSLARNLLCSGSAIHKSFFQNESFHAMRGTAIHELAADTLRERYLDKKGVPDEKTRECLSETCPGIELDQANELVSAYVDYVEGQLRPRKRYKVLVEESLSVELIEGIQLSGRADLIVILTDEIHVFDLKTGHTRIEAANNAQLLAYSILALDKATKRTRGAERRVYGHIVQPTINNFDVVEYDPSQLITFKEDCVALAERLQRGEVSYEAGKHCEYCPSLLTCAYADDKLKRVSGRSAEAETTDPDELRSLYDLASKARDIGSAVLKDVHALAVQGAYVTGMKLEPGARVRVWSDKKKASRFLRKSGLYEKDFKIVKLKSPKAIEDEFGLSCDGFTVTRDSETKLVAGEQEVKTPNLRTRLAISYFRDFLRVAK